MVLLAIFCGLWQFVSTTDFGYTLSDTLGQPVVVGTVVGLVMGDLAGGLAIGGALELLYLGIIYPGGTVPACASSAALIAIPIALSTGLDAGAATVLAVPFGILGSVIWNLKYSINSTWGVRVDACIEKKDFKGAMRNAVAYPLVLAFVLAFFPVCLANLAGAAVVTPLIDAIPDWAMHGIEVAGSLLPAIGFAIAVATIGQPKIMPFFFIGYFVVQYFGLGAMAVGIFGACIALLFIFLGKDGAMPAAGMTNKGE